MGSRSFLQGIFPTQGYNPGILHFRQILYQLRHQGCPRILGWVAYPFSSGSSWTRNRTRVSRIAGRFFTNSAIRDANQSQDNATSASLIWLCGVLTLALPFGGMGRYQDSVRSTLPFAFWICMLVMKIIIAWSNSILIEMFDKYLNWWMDNWSKHQWKLIILFIQQGNCFYTGHLYKAVLTYFFCCKLCVRLLLRFGLTWLI